MNYLILQNPGHNRVYYKSADKLALAELKIACNNLSTECSNIKIIEIEGIRYLSFETLKELTEQDLQLISRLSFVFAIYLLEKINDKICLIPLPKFNYEYLDDKISSLLKYQGKTNELFTKMMVNVALLSSNYSYSDKITMLDPVAGRGTTLFEGMVYGFNVYGIEIDSKSVHESSIFFKKYLETERIKHNSTKRRVFSTNKSDTINIQEFEYAKTKQEFKSDETIKKFGIIEGNTKDAYKYFKKEMFHLIVGDLPYGIFHGNTNDKKNTSITRNPSELLNESLLEWKKVLFKGGVIVMAWNSYLVNREKLSGIFKSHNFNVLMQNPYDEFEHMVDKSIKRDIIVAQKE